MMNGIFQADIENRGLLLDPRTKLFILIVIAVFGVGGTGSDIHIMSYAVTLISILPLILLCTAGKVTGAVGYGIMFGLLNIVQIYLLPLVHGSLYTFLAMVSMAVIRLLPSLIMGSYLVSTTTVSEFIAAMHRMHVSQQITIPLSVMFRFFPTVTEEFSSINNAMKMRDIRPGGKNAGKMFEYRIIPLLVCSVNIGNELSAAALTRGLGGNVRRTNICRIGFKAQDVIMLLLSLSPVVILILGRAGVVE